MLDTGSQVTAAVKTALQGLFNIRNHSSFPELADQKYSHRASQKDTHSLKEKLTHTLPICFLFLHHPEQRVPGSATDRATHRWQPPWSHWCVRAQKEEMGLGNGKDSDAHSINLHAMSDLFQNKQKVYTLSSSLPLRRLKWNREESHPDR